MAREIVVTQKEQVTVSRPSASNSAKILSPTPVQGSVTTVAIGGKNLVDLEGK
jgi:hypothetical protein